MKHRTLLVVFSVSFALATSVALLTPRPAAAGESGSRGDHLVCYKSRKNLNIEGTIVETYMKQFGTLNNCVVKRAAQFCAPAHKKVHQFGGGAVGNSFEGRAWLTDMLCYKFACDEADPIDRFKVFDQFGTRGVKLKTPAKLCVPATKNICPDTEDTFARKCDNIDDEAQCNGSWQINNRDVATS